jgi:hypothetical protein
MALGLLVLLSSWICLRLEKGRFPFVGLRLNGRWAWEALLGAGLGLGLILLSALLVLATGGFHWEREGAGSVHSLLAGAWLFVGVALSEELLFRGYAFQRLVRGLGPWPAQALLFALAHWSNPGMSGTTQPGLLRPVFHGRPEWLTGGAFGLEASLPALVVLAGCCLWMLGWKSPQAEAIEAETEALPAVSRVGAPFGRKASEDGVSSRPQRPRRCRGPGASSSRGRSCA